MKQKYRIPLQVTDALLKLGEDIRNTRRRRRITMALLAGRAGINAITLGKIEKGHASTSIGAYASVLYELGMIKRLSDIADGRHDLTGRTLADERLPKRVRIRKDKNEGRGFGGNNDSATVSKPVPARKNENSQGEDNN